MDMHQPTQGLLARILPQGMMGLLGSGMAQNAAAMMQSRPYQIHVQEAMALGQQPMAPEQFMRQMQAGLLGRQMGQ
jgi:hypothetical protein